MGKDNQVSAFSLEGRFLGFVVEDGYKLKRLRLGTAEGEQSLKLSKELKARLRWDLTPGDWFYVSGEQKLDRKTGEVKLKADRIMPIAPRHLDPIVPPKAVEPNIPSVAKPKTCILVCQKSDCMKRGGKEVCHALAADIRDRGLDNQVTIKGTGCMKQCKAGPNIVMPDKTRYSRIDADEIPVVMEKHFPTEVTSELTPVIPEKVITRVYS